MLLGNILLAKDDTRRRRLKIGDFGTACTIGSVVTEGGDGRYIAPELITITNIQADCRFDIFSLGIMTYEMGTHCEMTVHIWEKLLNTEEYKTELQFGRMSLDLQELVMQMIDANLHSRPTASSLLNGLSNGSVQLQAVAHRLGVTIPKPGEYVRSSTTPEDGTVDVTEDEQEVRKTKKQKVELSHTRRRLFG